MIVPGSASPLLSTTEVTGYNLTKSLRFRSGASAYLNRTPGSAGNRQKWTWSGWVKRGKLGSSGILFACRPTTTPRLQFQFNSTDTLAFFADNNTTNLETTAVYRDPSAWYHVIYAVDTTQATSSNRIKLYVNGSQVTNFSTAVYPNQNDSLNINTTTAHTIGVLGFDSSAYFDGYMAEVNFVDGQQLTPSSFGETDSLTGVWKPKAYSGTYGTNGFYLKFTDVATTSGSNAGLGKDFSGNGNYWTTNNISVTSGSTYDSMKDVPTLTDTDTANYAVINPLNYVNGAAPTNGNLKFIDAGAGVETRTSSTFAVSSDKWYWESTIGGSNINIQAGIHKTSTALSSNTGLYTFASDGQKRTDGTYSSYGSSWSPGDVIGVAVDLSNGKIWFSKNGTWQASGDPSAGTNAAFTGISGEYFSFWSTYNNGSGSSTVEVNFGQRPFAYTPPTGYKALNTYNL